MKGEGPSRGSRSQPYVPSWKPTSSRGLPPVGGAPTTLSWVVTCRAVTRLPGTSHSEPSQAGTNWWAPPVGEVSSPGTQLPYWRR